MNLNPDKPNIPTPYTEYTRLPRGGWVFRLINAVNNPNITQIFEESRRTCQNLNRAYWQNQAGVEETERMEYMPEP